MTAPPPPWWLAMAEALDGLASWIDWELAGGVPSKAVARKTAEVLRALAAGLRDAGDVR